MIAPLGRGANRFLAADVFHPFGWTVEMQIKAAKAKLRTLELPVRYRRRIGWCPLLMKEIANGGHLDSIAIFLTTLAVCLLVRTWQASLKATGLTPGQAPGRSTRLPTKSLPKWVGAVLTSGALALAIGAKLYPVVLLPLFLAVWMRRHGWATAVVGLASTTLIAAVLLYRMVLGKGEKR